MAAEDRDLNRDPITDEPGAHPVGTGLGATGGAVAGATMGVIGGPIGSVVGGVVGAVVGGLAGKAAGEAINPTAEEAYWRNNYTKEPYFESGRTFDDYAPAYRLGLTGRTQNDDWSMAEPRLQSEWEKTRGASTLDWAKAQHASRAAWMRVETTGAAAMVGQAQSAGDNTVDRDDVIDILQDLAECSLDGEFGFRECAEQADRADLKSMFLQRADDCRGAAVELNEQIRSMGGSVTEHGSAAAALHRGWVSVKTTFTTYDDKAVLEEAERGEDNAKARYKKALTKPLPASVKLIVERQMQGVQRNHDQVKSLRDQARAAS